MQPCIPPPGPCVIAGLPGRIRYLELSGTGLCQHRASLGPNTSQEEVYLSSLAPLLTTFMDMDVEVRGRGATPPLTTS